MRTLQPLVATALGLVASATFLVAGRPRAAGAVADVPTIDVDAIKPGMKGYGLTVFEGTSPEKFDVEVINVLHKFRPNQDLILVKTIHPRLEKVKVVAGMSGSPIFLNDGGTSKLAGAYAYGWNFGNEPVAGVTPIASMLAEVNRPLSPMLLPPAGKPPIGAPPKVKTAALDSSGAGGGVDGSAVGFSGEPGAYSLEEHVRQVAARLRPGGNASTLAPTPVDTPLVVGGMSDRAVKELTTMLAPLGIIPLQGGGAGVPAAAKDAPDHFVDGGAIAVQLLRGDSAAQATGTVTHVMGKKLVAFGHPMMEVGATALPTAVAKILWILSSDSSSFKIGEPVRNLGTLIQDRQPCIVVDSALSAPMIPMSIDLEGDPTAPKSKWNIEVVNDKFMSPMWTAFAFADAVGTTLSDRKDASWTLTSTLKLKGKPSMVLDDFGVSGGGVSGSAFFVSRAGQAVGELLNNPWEPVEVERIDSKMVVSWSRDSVRLRGAELLDNPVDAGQSARVKLTLKPYYGDEVTVIGSIKIDAALAGKDIDLEVIPGWSAFPDSAAPESLDQLIHNLTLPTLSPKSFVLQYRAAELGVAVNGNVASRLPGFAIDALKSTSSTEVPEIFSPMVRSEVAISGYAEGTTKLRLTVRAPVK